MIRQSFRLFAIFSLTGSLLCVVPSCSKTTTAPNNFELDASPLSHEVVLTWEQPAAMHFNVYTSSDKDCDFGKPARCADSTVATDVRSPYTVTSLQNEKAYYFKVEAVAADTASTWSFTTGARPNLIRINGSINAITPGANGIVYIGGNFSRIGAYNGGGAVFDVTRISASLPEMPIVQGTIDTAISDGLNGWFIGGEFTTVGRSARTNVAHILANGTVDGAWRPQVSGPVNRLALHDGTVYIVSDYTLSAYSMPVSRLEPLDRLTGDRKDWKLDIEGHVTSLAIGKGLIYIAGSFTTLEDHSRSGLAAINEATGKVTSWNPNANGGIAELTLLDDLMYVGGWFTSIGEQNRNGLAALDASTGEATSWNPARNGMVHSITVSSDAVVVYSNNEYSSTADEHPYRLSAFARDTAATPLWTLQVDLPVSAIAADQDRVYVAGGPGGFRDGLKSDYLLAFDVTTGAPTPWHPAVNGLVRIMAVSGTSVYVGGSFSTVGGRPSSNLAAIEARTGNPTIWNPQVTGPVYAIAVKDDIVYAGGSFSSTGGKARNNLAALNSTTGIPTDWNPNPDSSIGNLSVANNVIYATGTFTSIGGEKRRYLAALDASSGNATPWNPEPDAFVHTVTCRGDTIYVGGQFTSIGGLARNHLAALSSESGIATDWNPDVDKPVYSAAILQNTLYIGGAFNTVGGDVNYRLAALDTTTGKAFNWGPRNLMYSLEWGGVSAIAATNDAIYYIIAPSELNLDRRAGYYYAQPVTNNDTNYYQTHRQFSYFAYTYPTGTDVRSVDLISASGGYIYVGGSQGIFGVVGTIDSHSISQRARAP